MRCRLNLLVCYLLTYFLPLATTEVHHTTHVGLVGGLCSVMNDVDHCDGIAVRHVNLPI